MNEKDKSLLFNLKQNLPELQKRLEVATSHWGYEDPIYRFYYHSFKVYGLQDQTRKIAEALKLLAPEGCTLCSEFEELLEAGAAGNEFELDHNRNWTHHTRPIVEAFFHAKYFLEMAVKYGLELDEPPSVLPSGWAALLCLYGMR